jgi:predicted RecA/RadA family phage recombinase
MATNAKYWQRGEVLDYTNTSDALIAAGSIISFGKYVGVTGTDIAPGATGSVHVGGVWLMPKSGSTAIEMGTPVYFDGAGITSEEGDATEAGYAAAAAAADADTVLVKLRG